MTPQHEHHPKHPQHHVPVETAADTATAQPVVSPQPAPAPVYQAGPPIPGQQPYAGYVPPVQQQYQQPYYQQQTQYYPPQQMQAPYVPKPHVPGETMGLASVILASASIFVSLILGPLAIIAVIAGLVTGIMGHNESKRAGVNNTMATVGIWLNAVFLALGVAIIIGFVVLFVILAKTSHSSY